MKVLSKALTLSFILILVSCSAAKWVRIDGRSTNPEYIKKSSSECKIDEKIYQLQQSESIAKYTGFIADSDVAKNNLKDAHQEKVDKILKEIGECMKGKGLKKDQ